MTTTPSLAEVIALSEKLAESLYVYVNSAPLETSAQRAAYQSGADALAAWRTRTSAASLRDEDARDAARYRWLRMYADHVKAAHGLVDWEWEEGEDGVPDYSLDAAIDAATQPAAQERQA